LQHQRINGLDEVVVDADLLGLTAIRFRAMAGQGRQQHMLQHRLLPQPSRQFVTVHSRQTNIQEDDLRLQGLRRAERRRAVVGDRHFMARSFQQQREAPRRTTN
jgi:hypothetical protein